MDKDKKIGQENIVKIFEALNHQIKAHNGSPINLVVCGGTALTVLNLIDRTTKDVDVLGLLVEDKGSIFVKKINEFPKWFEKATRIVQRDFVLPENWINTGPTSQVESGLPEGFEKRLIEKRYGEYLTIYFISRLDQIHFKLYAAVDRDDYHIDDLFALKPIDDEIEMATQWVLTQDVSEEFKLILKDFLRRYNYGNIAERI